ncbi:MAG: MFS transporter [Pseudomonadota bacterium]|nr:MFS transporter [Pseudomonadota bacterium]
MLPVSIEEKKQRALIAIVLSSFGLGVAFGGYLPLLSLWLENKEVSFSNIGLITGSASIGVVITAYLSPAIVSTFGYLKGAVFGLSLAAAAGLAFRFVEGDFFWILLRLIAGLGFGLHWVITEAWLGQIVSDRNRTKSMSLYTSAMALGFAGGPVIIWTTGFTGVTPFILITIIQLLSITPLLTLSNIQPGMKVESIKSPFFLTKSAPTIAAGCVLVGIIDLSLVSLVPALVNRTTGSVHDLAFLLPIAAGVGTFLLQYPIALFADKFGKRGTANFVTILGILCCAAIPFFFEYLIIPLVLVFIGCGSLYSIYTISLARLSERFKGKQLIAANASFIILFDVSSIVGPLLAGTILDWSLRFGLSFFLISIGSIYLLISAFRALQGKADG